MNNPNLYQKNDLWQKINQKVNQIEQDLEKFAEGAEIFQEEVKNGIQQIRQNFELFLEFWQRELEIIELETDAHHCSETRKRRNILKEMSELIRTNQQLKKRLKWKTPTTVEIAVND